MKFLLIISALLASLFSEVKTETVSCETIGSQTWFDGPLLGSQIACYMQTTTTINSDDFVISPADSSVKVLEFNNNKKIKFLPIKVDETFSNLAAYLANSCSIKDVSKKNFKNLNKLKSLSLDGNQIEQINSDTFEDLTSLEVLLLRNNKIEKMNGAAFRGLSRLTKVYLTSNVCIKKYYQTPTAIATLPQEVDANCRFTEGNSENSGRQNESIRKVMKKNTELMAENARLQARLESAASITAKMLALKSQLRISDDSLLDLNSQMSALKQLCTQCERTMERNVQ